MRALFLSLLLLSGVVLIPLPALAQQETVEDTVDMGVLLRKETAGSIMAHTLGFGVGFRKAWNKTYYRKQFLEFDLLEMKAPNQDRRYNENFQNPRSYIYGKLNTLYVFRAGAGQTKLLNRKPYWGGIDVQYFYSGGLSLGLAAPMYLYIAYYTIENELTYYSLELEKYDPEKHFPQRGINPNCDCDIYGKGPMLSGLSEIKPYPGLYLKTGFNFDFSSMNDRIKALETGIVAEAYPKRIPLMAFDDPYRLFLTAYLSFHLGKRHD